MLSEFRKKYLLRTGGLIISSTIILTASFIGILSFLDGNTTGLSARNPYYLVFAALIFTVSVIFLERNDVAGRIIIATAIAMGVASFILLALAFEGIIYTVNNPEEVFVSQLILYFIAAGLVGTGFGYWALKHWRELTSPDKGKRGRL